MIILHAVWLPETARCGARLALWAETGRGAGAPRRVRGKAHPFAAPARAIEELLPGASAGPNARAGKITLLLPSCGRVPQPSRSLLWDAPASKKIILREWEVPALLFEPAAAPIVLTGLAAREDGGRRTEPGADARFWRAAARFALELLAGQRFRPVLLKEDGRWSARWRPILDSPDEQARLESLAAAMPSAARCAIRSGKEPLPARGRRALLADFLDASVDAFVRVTAHPPRLSAGVRATPAGRWLAALAAPDSNADLPDEFVEDYRAWDRLEERREGDFRLCFRLDPPGAKESDGMTVPDPRARDWKLRYFLQAGDDVSLLVPASEVWRARGSALRFLNRRFDAPQERMLAGLGSAARVFPPIESSLRAARPEACRLDAQSAYSFIRETALLLQSSGFGVLLPGIGAKAGLRLRLRPARNAKAPAGGTGGLSMANVIAFDWELALGGQVLSREEFERLAELKIPLVRIRGQWAEVRPDLLEKASAFLSAREEGGGLSLADALRTALAPETAGLAVESVQAEGWLAELLGRLGGGEKMEPLAAPAGFAGTLRPYQSAGLSWLAFLGRFGLGACLADDMGLGKTPQAIAYLLHRRSGGGRRPPALVVCPTSVVGNWEHELARFAPGLKVLVHHGTGRGRESFAREAAGRDVVVTSYALLHRDSARMREVEWGEVILDEAQNIKNPGTRQAAAARALRAGHRLALTGTPLENRLAELWSIFQFLNPGWLGSQESFQRSFARPIERMGDSESARRLRLLSSPFILRRVKTDRSIISDLPPKNEMKVFCSLTREQATLYRAVVADSLRAIEGAEGIGRRGAILAALTAMKQVCNHPAHFLGDGSALPGRSGKLERLVEMLEEVLAVGERALIFTQFAEMGGLLRAHLQETLGAETLFLCGAVRAAERTKMIARFQEDPRGPPLFVLSLKAGGTGVNLTRANHVFHFDRWWNPAVENQATDRAFRIGQSRAVQVHKLMCAGTVEERIDEMIERKRKLADEIVGAGEGWITEMTAEQLRELFVLRGGAAD
ncbi:MAG: DEAD/DEAH box helicase [Anaerolineales bacterium]|nr:DEAD/DEAH box helicase [Anaerolineales bacterium]